LERVETPRFTKKEVKKMPEVEKIPTVVVPERICTKCGEKKPATPDLFGRSKEGKYGLKSYCKICESKASADRWRRKHPGKDRREYRARVTPKVKADPVPLVRGPAIAVTPLSLFREMEKQFVEMACKAIREAFGL